VIGSEVVEIRDDRHLQVRFHQKGGDDALLQRPLRRMLSWRLRKDNGDAVAAHADSGGGGRGGYGGF
jgi:hypothetical protein